MTPKSHNEARKEHWQPEGGAKYSPVFSKPWSLRAFLSWLFGWGGFIWPRHIFHLGLAIIAWQGYRFTEQIWFVGKPIAVVIFLILKNLVLMTLVYTFFHYTLYVRKVRGVDGKYHPKWQATDSRKFLFGNQVKDNMFRSLVVGVPIWSAWEVLYLTMVSNGRISVLNWSENPVWFIGLFFLIPFWRETHFYFIHRLIHWKPLLRVIHSVHHKNPNPGPWSGLAMHPIETLLYMSVVAIHFIVPGHPIHFLFNSQVTALTPAHAHSGFEGSFGRGLMPYGEYFHYLHHKHVSCNFGSPNVPWDRWLCRYYNGIGPYQTRNRSGIN